MKCDGPTQTSCAKCCKNVSNVKEARFSWHCLEDDYIGYIVITILYLTHAQVQWLGTNGQSEKQRKSTQKLPSVEERLPVETSITHRHAGTGCCARSGGTLDSNQRHSGSGEGAPARKRQRRDVHIANCVK